jgi:hypothetical protein
MQDLLRRLGYTQKWIDYGFLDRKALGEQILEFESGHGPNPEHYRFRRFLSVLESRASLTGKEIDQYVELALEDPDQAMGRSALIELIRWPGLQEPEYERLAASHTGLQDVVLRRALTRARLIRILAKSDLAADDCDLCIRQGDSVVQRRLLERARLSREQLEYLKSHGRNRAIRNMAASMLRRRSDSVGG